MMMMMEVLERMEHSVRLTTWQRRDGEKVWTAHRHDSLGVITIEWSLIDRLSEQTSKAPLCCG